MKTIRFRPSSLALVVLMPLALLSMACGGGQSTPIVNPPEPPATPLDHVRIEVKERGLVRVTFEELSTAGFTQGVLRADGLKLENQGKPVALSMKSTTPSTFGPGDYLEFYAEGIDTEFTDTNVYWLSAGTSTPMGKRDVPASGGTPLRVFHDTLHVEQNTRMWGLTPGAPAKDAWFWEQLTAPVAKDYPFQLAGLAEENGPSRLKLCVHGKTSGAATPDHHVRVGLNGTWIGDLKWDGITEKIQEFDVLTGILKPGANTFTLQLPGDTGATVNTVLLNYFEIQHWRPLEVLDGQLVFNRLENTSGSLQIDGFTGPDIRLLDITDPWNAVSMQGFVTEKLGTAYSLRFQDPSPGTKTYLALPLDRVRSSLKMECWRPGALRASSASADYILITPRAFIQAAEPLCQFRRNQGLRVVSVAVEDIFNEFGQGFPDPAAIKAFLDFAYHSWAKPAPAFVLLLGDATYDYRGRMGLGKLSRVPAHLSITADLGLTPDDNWYVAVDGMDELPDMRIGRLPAPTPELAAQMVQKILRYEGAAAMSPPKAMFVADNNDLSFQQECEKLIALLPSGMTSRKVYLSQYTNFDLATQDIITGLNEGMLLTAYCGHGDVTEWAGERVFNAGDIPLLNNDASRLTFTFMMNCLNSWFAMPGSYCLAESLVTAQDRGAIGAFASSGLGYTWEHDLLAVHFFNLFFRTDRPTIGQVCTEAKVLAHADGASLDLVRTFTLLGDPGMRLKGIP